MSLKLTQRLTIFLDRRSHNWQERLCLITFLVLSLSVIVAGVPMHIFGFIGRNHVALQALSALTWVTTLVIFVCYLLQRLSLKVAISTFGILTQLTDSARIVCMTLSRPEGFVDTILFNQVISLALIIYLVMAVVRHVPAIITSLSIATITFAYLYSDGEINEQLVLIFVIVEIFTCILGELIRQGIGGIRLLATFRMTKTELLAYIQLGRGGMEDKDITNFFDHLDERTEANLIKAVKQRVAQRRMQHADISAVLPTLTPTEQEVCRLIIGGKTILEIAAILNKTANNISTVRIHIRKKLGLATTDDLRESLLNAMGT